MKVITEESEELGLLEINDDLFTYDTPLRAIFNKFNRLTAMDDDLFTYEVGIHGLSFITCGAQQVDDSDDEDIDEQRMCLDENKSLYAEAKRGDDEVVLTNEELSDVEDENLIDENEFNYLLKVDADLLTNDIHGFKTSVSRMEKLNGPLVIQMMKDFAMEENYQE
ncbi:hypothetical protein Tco_1463707 [Tanacetum coccineum]